MSSHHATSLSSSGIQAIWVADVSIPCLGPAVGESHLLLLIRALSISNYRCGLSIRRAAFCPTQTSKSCLAARTFRSDHPRICWVPGSKSVSIERLLKHSAPNLSLVPPKVMNERSGSTVQHVSGMLAVFTSCWVGTVFMLTEWAPLVAPLYWTIQFI